MKKQLDIGLDSDEWLKNKVAELHERMKKTSAVIQQSMMAIIEEWTHLSDDDKSFIIAHYDSVRRKAFILDIMERLERRYIITGRI